MSELLHELLAEFELVTTFQPQPTNEYLSDLINICRFLQDKPLRPGNKRRQLLLGQINRKFRLNQDALAALYGSAAKSGFTFNYHEKEAIQQAFDLCDQGAFAKILRAKRLQPSVQERLLGLFLPLAREATLKALACEVAEPSRLRRDKGRRQIDREILQALLSSFVFSLAEQEVLHSFFDQTFSREQYKSSFWHQLRVNRPELFKRDHTLEILHIGPEFSMEFSDYSSLQSAVMHAIRQSYPRLNNHGYFAIWVEPLVVNGHNATWQLVESLKLFAEKFIEVPLKHKYFAHDKIAHETASYVPSLNPEKAKFNLANEGFTYRDCFVLCPSSHSAFGSESLLVLFQKNQRDETPIPCPACRSQNVRGNSYPALGVRSWECRNLLCPDRSKYNRGKRYSFRSLLMQEAISNPKNSIPGALVKSWSRDVQVGRQPCEVIEMLVRFYSLHGDSIHLVGFDSIYSSQHFGRSFHWHNITGPVHENLDRRFLDSAWFHRYAVNSKEHDRPRPKIHSKQIGPFQLVNGDARLALSSFKDSYFDGAVTSPPYYNAREYSQWPNIYCYLYDMFEIIKECHRVLKPGAFFLFNIFDNFDNERSIVFSAMGKKKLVLSSMLVDLFRRAGFTLFGSVVWDKGEIEGKRAFNGGNFSPYYQSPFNCWEHVLVFGKPDDRVGVEAKSPGGLPSILRAQPVIKMIRGENLHGHTAPFPLELPALLASLTGSGSIVLDPFGGSGTTARALCHKGIAVVCIESNQSYCVLAERMYRESSSSGVQLDFFPSHGLGLNLEVDLIK